MSFKLSSDSLKNRNAKFNRDQVIAIRELQGKKSAQEVAEQYGVKPGTIYAIWNRTSYMTVK